MLMRSPISGSLRSFLLFLCHSSTRLCLIASWYVFNAICRFASISGFLPLLAMATFLDSSLMRLEISSSLMLPISSCSGWKYIRLLYLLGVLFAQLMHQHRCATIRRHEFVQHPTGKSRGDRVRTAGTTSNVVRFYQR